MAVGMVSGGWRAATGVTATKESMDISLRTTWIRKVMAEVAVAAVIYSVNLIRSGLDCGAKTTGPMSCRKGRH